jgi:hypothetical protein
VQSALLVTYEYVIYLLTIIVECIIYGDDSTTRVTEDGINALGKE